MTAFQVRRARPEDVEGTLDLLDAIAEERKYILTEPPLDRERRRQRQLEMLASDDTQLFVADASGEIAGELSAVRRATTGPATIGMGVAAGWRGRGVGTAHMHACLNWGREARVHKLSLEVFPWNEAAIALYRKFGFVEEGRRARTQSRPARGTSRFPGTPPPVRFADRRLRRRDVVVMGLVLEP